MTTEELNILKQKSYNCILELATPDGIHASGKTEAFGCIFGRDSFITILKLLRTTNITPDSELIAICKRTLLTHVGLQGKVVNIESGEQPGKFIHEYRVDKYERLINRPRPWYVYPDKKLRNYDSLDATPLGLIAIYNYWLQTKDNPFLLSVLSSVEQALRWIINYGDMDHDYLLEYELAKDRIHGGLVVQSWADSAASLANKDGELPPYPIAPVEVQGIAWLALKLWGEFYKKDNRYVKNTSFGNQLLRHAAHLKNRFNSQFVIENKGKRYLAQALDGNKRQISTITANPLICLWSAYINNQQKVCIINKEFLSDIVDRAFLSDMFIPHAGIRTMSSESETFNPTERSYHSGSFWPMLNGLIIEGLENFDFAQQADLLKQAMLQPLNHFGSPIELYIEQNGTYGVYKSIWGQQSCTNQAWSAAAAYDVLTHMLKTSVI